MTARRNPLRRHREVQPVEPTELTALITWVYLHRSEPHAKRDVALYLLMADGGLRLNEALTLRLYDVYRGASVVHTIDLKAENCKYGSARQIPLSRRLIDALELYLQSFARKANGRNTWLFPSSQNIDKHLTQRSVQLGLRRASQAACGKNFHPHQLRHHCGTQLAAVTSMHVVKRLLGHKSISTTQIYTHASIAQCREAIAAIGKEE